MVPLLRDHEPAGLAPELDACGVDQVVVVQAAETLAENLYTLGLAAREPRIAGVVGFSNRVPSVNPSLRSPHPSLARHHPTDPVSGPAIVLSRFEGACAGPMVPVSGPAIVLSRFEGACAGPMVLSAVGTRPPHDGSSSESAFPCGSSGPRAAAT